jgi:hypothetical protein
LPKVEGKQTVFECLKELATKVLKFRIEFFFVKIYLICETLHLHRSRRHLTVLFGQHLSDQGLHVEEQDVTFRVLRVGSETIDD